MKTTGKKQKKYTVKDYYAETIWVGGLETTRGQFIIEMRAAGHSQRLIDMWLIGNEVGIKSRTQRAQREWEAAIEDKPI